METDPVRSEQKQEPQPEVVGGIPHTPEEIELIQQFAEALEKRGLTEPLTPSASQSAAFAEFLRQHPEEALAVQGLCGDGFLPPDDAPDLLPPTINNEENDRGFFDRFKICLCSEVTGVITKDGQPVVGAEIVRRLVMFLPTDEVRVDRTLTDAQGRYAFKPAYSKHRKLTLSEVRTHQTLLVIHEGKAYVGWGNCSAGRDLHRDISGSIPDVKEFPMYGGFYYHLDFDGDLARATPLPDGSNLEQRNFEGEGFFNHQTVCVASYFRFVLTMNGKPVHGAKVTRTAEHVGYKTYVQTKPSPYDGEVELYQLYAPRLIHPWEKTEIRQKIVIEYEGKEYLAWERTKTNRWEYGEVNPDDREHSLSPQIISAELTDPVMIREVKTHEDDLRHHFTEDTFSYKGFLQVQRKYPR